MTFHESTINTIKMFFGFPESTNILFPLICSPGIGTSECGRPELLG